MLDQNTQVRSAKNRLVKVENIGENDYTEEFKGDLWTIPAHGFILKPVLEANRFVGQFKRPLKKINGRWEPINAPKPIRLLELSASEREKLEGVTEEQNKASEDQENKSLAFACMKCGFKGANEKGLKIHMKLTHSEEE